MVRSGDGARPGSDWRQGRNGRRRARQRRGLGQINLAFLLIEGRCFLGGGEHIFRSCWSRKGLRLAVLSLCNQGQGEYSWLAILSYLQESLSMRRGRYRF